jgi:hypothetical protein
VRGKEQNWRLCLRRVLGLDRGLVRGHSHGDLVYGNPVRLQDQIMAHSFLQGGATKLLHHCLDWSA